MRFVKSLILLLTTVSLAIVLAPSVHAAGEVNLEWDQSPDSRVVGYNVYRSDTPYPLNGGTLVSGTSFTDSSVMLDQLYYYGVTAVDAIGQESGMSNIIPAMITSNQAPVGTIGDSEFSASGDSEFSVSDNAVDKATTAVPKFIEIAPEAPGLALGMAIIDYPSRPNSGAVFQNSIPMQHGRTHVRVQGSHHTAVAMSNPNSETALINYALVHEEGYVVHVGQFFMSPGDTVFALLGVSPFETTVDLTSVSSFSFWTSAPVATAAVRTFTNERSEVLMTSLAIANLDSPSQTSTTIPFYADGGGWQSEVQLVNPTDVTLTGTVQLVTLEGGDTYFAYYIPPYSAVSLHTPGEGSFARSGWALITPANGTSSPVSSLLVLNNTNGVTTTLGTVYATDASSSYHVYVEKLESQQSSSGLVTIANPASTEAFVTLDLLNMSGESVGVRGALTIGAYGAIAFQLREIPGMESIDGAFTGILRIGGDPVTAASFLGRHENAVYTVLPAISSDARPSAFQKRFLFSVEGGGYTTQLK